MDFFGNSFVICENVVSIIFRVLFLRNFYYGNLSNEEVKAMLQASETNKESMD